MAGKKKQAMDDGAKQSKTSRASSLKKGGKKEGFIAAAPENLKRIISLNGGKNAYLLDPRDGRTHHLAVGSDKYFALLSDLDATDHGVHIRAELEALGWEVPTVASESLA